MIFGYTEILIFVYLIYFTCACTHFRMHLLKKLMWLKRYSVIVLGQPLKPSNTLEQLLKNFLSSTKTSKQQSYIERRLQWRNSSSSYLHTEWAAFSKLQAGDKRFESKMKRYKAKQEQLGVFSNVSVHTSTRHLVWSPFVYHRLMMSHSTLSTP